MEAAKEAWIDFEISLDDTLDDQELEAYWDGGDLPDRFKESIVPAIQKYNATKASYGSRQALPPIDRKRAEKLDDSGSDYLRKTLRLRNVVLNELRTYSDAIARLRNLLQHSGSLEATASSQEVIAARQKEVQAELAALESEVKELENISALRVTREEVSLGRGWVGPWHVGEGGMGKVQVWVKQDGSGAIENRLAIKNVIQKEGESKAPWNGSEFWWPWTGGGMDDKFFKKHIPVEVVAPKRLRRLVGGEGVVRVLNWRINVQKRHLRLYQEYCPYGDLSDFIQASLKRAGQERLWVPEAFIWHMLETVVRVFILCEEGELDHDPISDSLDRPPWGHPWDLIIHRDLKAGNIFLDLPFQDRYRGWPAPKVGHWGLATMIAKDDKRDERVWFSSCGTPGCRAPELTTEERMKIPTNKVDVFGVGHLAWSLMEMSWGDQLLRWEQEMLLEEGREAEDESKWNEELGISDAVKATYSAELVELTSWCVNPDRDKRPEWWQVLQAIQKGQDPEVRDANIDDPVFGRDWPLPLHERYKISAKLKTPLHEGLPAGMDDVPQPPESPGDDDIGGKAGTAFGEDGSAQGQRDGDENGTRAGKQTNQPPLSHRAADGGAVNDKGDDDDDDAPAQGTRRGTTRRGTSTSRPPRNAGTAEANQEPTANGDSSAEAARQTRKRNHDQVDQEREVDAEDDLARGRNSRGQGNAGAGPRSQTNEGARPSSTTQPPTKRTRQMGPQDGNDGQEEVAGDADAAARQAGAAAGPAANAVQGPGLAVGAAVAGTAAPEQAAPGQAAPGQAAPGQAAPGQAAPGQAAPGPPAAGPPAAGTAVPAVQAAGPAVAPRRTGRPRAGRVLWQGGGAPEKRL